MRSIFISRANRMEKELKEGPAADRAWYQPAKKKKKGGDDADDKNKRKVTKSKQKRNEARAEASTAATREADFFAREAKRKRKPQKIRSFNEKEGGPRGGKNGFKNGGKNRKKSNKLL